MKLAIVTFLLLASAAQAQPNLERLSWLAGCWARETSARVEAGSVEQWMAPAGGTMLGMARTVRGGKTIEHEFLHIAANAEGQLTYTARPSGQKEASFTALRQGESEGKSEIVFENLQHDFPQRVMYRLEPEGRLMARIEGLRNGQLRGIDFPLRRVACEGGSKP